MGENSAISWTDHTFNPWVGCMKVGPGCDHCYAETWDARGLSKGPRRWGAGAPRTRTSAANWQKPRAWNRGAERSGLRPWVFCASLADVFDNEVDPVWRGDLWDLVRETPALRWIIVTKRIGNAAKMLPGDWTSGAFGHVGLMSTIVNQAEADRDVPKLLATPAAWRGLSMEPLLGPVNIEPWLSPERTCEQCDDGEGYGNRCCSDMIPRAEQCPWKRAVQIEIEHPPSSVDGMPGRITCDVRTLDWVICGGESGPGARPMHPDWARSLRDQCVAAGVPFHFKQWGEWASLDDDAQPPGAFGEFIGNHWLADQISEQWPTQPMARIGKKAAGRLLDGVEHNGMPEVHHG